MANKKDVWSSNFMEELKKVDAALYHYPVVSIDTEFPGFLRNTPRHAHEIQRYFDLKYNVDATKLIQLGVTLSDEKGFVGGTWQFNFAFDVENEIYVIESVEFLKENGIDFGNLRKNGVDMFLFSEMFRYVLGRHRNLQWVTFHGLYDLAHMVKLVTRKPLPGSILDFTRVVANVFGGAIIDLKYMARLCDGLCKGKLGLEKLASILGVERVGGAHQAASDSLLTSAAFAKMKSVHQLEELRYVGFLYGISNKINAPERLEEGFMQCLPNIHRVVPTPVVRYRIPRIPIAMHPVNMPVLFS